MKSQPFKLQKITTLMAVQGGYWRFSQLVVLLHIFLPMISVVISPLSPIKHPLSLSL
ncbi:hypothetical protein HanHA89_Chr01g0017271 [Helianthus annuus]|nr:hypothetical protein HanHA89_Chr01g0017271 [Helianthus annuus]